MLVKHNVSTIPLEKFLIGAWRSSEYYERKYDGDILKFRSTISEGSGDAYAVTFNENEAGDFVYMELENLGGDPIRISIENVISGWYVSVIQPKQKIIICQKLTSKATLRFRALQNLMDWHILKCNAFSVTKGETDVYLPNIDTLPTDKQPLLPPEGEYKEIQPQ